jgi:hypothetical protein
MLTVKPCADIHYCANKDKAMIENVQAQNNENHKSGIDECSPLCVCNCCMAAVAQIKEISIDFIGNTLSKDNNTLYISSTTQSAIRSVLQPPRTI